MLFISNPIYSLHRLYRCLNIAYYRFFSLLWWFLLLPLLFSAQTACTNSDFEQSPAMSVTFSNQVAGWTITRGNNSAGAENCNMISCCPFDPIFSEVVNTSGGYVDPQIGSIYPFYSVFGPGQNTTALTHNPQLAAMGGNNILRINDFNSASILSEQATKSILVTPSTNVLKIAYSIVLVPYHLCCDGSGFRLSINTTTCLMVNTNACGSNSLAGYYTGLTGAPAGMFSTLIFSKWKVKVVDLSGYMGQVVTLSVTASRCIYGAHAGYAYIDTECDNSLIKLNGAPLSNTASVITASVCNSNITLSVDPFYESYLWTGPNGFQSTANSITTSQPGTYTVQLDQGSCDPILRVITITQPPPVYVSSSGSVCPGENVVLTANGAVSYTWASPAINTSTIQVQPLVTTVYSVTGTLNNGCKLYATYTITPKPLPLLSIQSPSSLCSGSSHSLFANGAITYEWFSTSGFYSNTQNTLFNAGTISGPVTFTLKGISADGCQASKLFTVQVMPLPVPSVTLLPSDSVCPNTEVTIKAGGGSFYDWDGPGNFQPIGETLVFSAYGSSYSGTYVVRATDQNGCTAKTSVDLYVIPPPSATIIGRRTGCIPFCTTLTSVPLPGSQIETTWKLRETASTGSELKPCFLSAGDYSVALALKDLQTTCTASLNTELNVYPLPVADFTTVPEELSEFLEEIELVNTSRGEHITYSKWYSTSNIKLDSGPGSFVHVNEAGVFPVALIVRNEWGCEDTVVKPLVIPEEPLIYIPDAFTPNNDGINDYFKPVTKGLVTYSFMIFDRWGKKIFEADQSSAGWNGTLKGSPCQDDVYNCLVLLQDDKLGYKKIQKRVSLIR